MCKTLHPDNHLHDILCFMAPLPFLLCYDTKNMPHLTGTPPHIYLLSRMDIVLTNQGGMAEQVADALKLELDERNIGDGYSTKI